MRRLLILLLIFGLAAGCGGGGGGSSPLPVVSAAPSAPAGSPSAPAPTPSATPTLKPTATPIPSPTPIGATPSPTRPPTPVPTATAVPTATPVPTPTATPTLPPTPAPTPTPGITTPGWNGQTLLTDPEYTDSNGVHHNPVVNGLDGQFNPPVGDTPSGGHGPSGNTIDQAGCEPSMSDDYHIHVFIGLYVNGTEYALPRGLGVANPEGNGPSVNYATMCFYYTHTHDSTGILHIEDPNLGVVDSPPVDSKYALKTFFDVWGISVNNAQFGQFAGPVEVFTSGQQYRGNDGPSFVVPESALQPWYGDPNTIPLYSHEVIWFLVGPSYPSQLPSVHFYEQY
jgi:hypothetical protein